MLGGGVGGRGGGGGRRGIMWFDLFFYYIGYCAALYRGVQIGVRVVEKKKK